MIFNRVNFNISWKNSLGGKTWENAEETTYKSGPFLSCGEVLPKDLYADNPKQT